MIFFMTMILVYQKVYLIRVEPQGSNFAAAQNYGLFHCHSNILTFLANGIKSTELPARNLCKLSPASMNQQ